MHMKVEGKGRVSSSSSLSPSPPVPRWRRMWANPWAMMRVRTLPRGRPTQASVDFFWDQAEKLSLRP